MCLDSCTYNFVLCFLCIFMNLHIIDFILLSHLFLFKTHTLKHTLPVFKFQVTNCYCSSSTKYALPFFPRFQVTNCYYPQSCSPCIQKLPFRFLTFYHMVTYCYYEPSKSTYYTCHECCQLNLEFMNNFTIWLFMHIYL